MPGAGGAYSTTRDMARLTSALSEMDGGRQPGRRALTPARASRRRSPARQENVSASRDVREAQR
jgi:CubicO group peptidase (beta-lactamase class C family)